MNIFNIERAFKLKQERGWDTIYWMIDLHDTVFPGKYASDQDFEVYDGALEVLRYISDHEDMKIIIWTSSYASHFEDVRKFFEKEHIIVLDWHNENPECGSTELADFDTKPYFNILLDDKASFCGEHDWFTVGAELERVTGDKVITWDANAKTKLTTGIWELKAVLDGLLYVSQNGHR
jgi:hypothetical protein